MGRPPYRPSRPLSFLTAAVLHLVMGLGLFLVAAPRPVPPDEVVAVLPLEISAAHGAGPAADDGSSAIADRILARMGGGAVAARGVDTAHGTVAPAPAPGRVASRSSRDAAAGSLARIVPVAAAPVEPAPVVYAARAALPAEVETAALAALAEAVAPSAKASSDLGGAVPPGAEVAGARHVGLATSPTPDPLEIARAERASRVYDEYGAYLRARIGPLWDFPKERALLGLEGTVRVAFVIHRDGTVSNIRVTRRSGFDDFDSNVVSAVKKAGPFKPLPPEIARDELRFDVPFDFDNPVVLFR